MENALNLSSLQEEGEPKLDIIEPKEEAKQANGVKEAQGTNGTDNVSLQVNGKAQEPESQGNSAVLALNGTEDHGIAPKSKDSSEPAEPGKEPVEPSKEPVEPSKEPAEPSKERAEPSKEPAEPSKETPQMEKSAPMSFGAHLVALWNKVASELSATNLTPGDILDGARFLLSLPPVNLGAGVAAVKDDILLLFLFFIYFYLFLDIYFFGKFLFDFSNI